MECGSLNNKKESLKDRVGLLKKYFLIIITMMIFFIVIYEENLSIQAAMIAIVVSIIGAILTSFSE